MGIVLRQSFKATLVSYFGASLSYLLWLRIYPDVFTIRELGVLKFLIAAMLLIYPFTTIGLPSIVVKYSSWFDEDSKARSGLRFIMVAIPLALSLAIFGAIWVCSDAILAAIPDSELLRDHWIWLIPLTIGFTIFTSWSAYSRSRLRLVGPTLLREVGLRSYSLTLALLVGAGILQFGHFLAWYSLAYWILCGALLVYLMRLDSIAIRPVRKLFPEKIKREVYRFGVASVMAGMGATVVSQIDALMIPVLVEQGELGDQGFYQAGIYALAAQIALLIELPKRSLSAMIMPVMSKAWKAGNLSEISRLYRRGSQNQLLIGIILFVLVWGSLHNLFDLIPKGAVFATGLWVVFYLGAARVLDMMMGPNSEVIMNSPYYFFNFIALIFLAALTIGTNLYFIPRFGITGAAMASAISLLLFNLSKFVFIWLRLGMQPLDKRTLGIILVAIGTGWVGYVLPDLDNLYFSMAYRSVIMIVVFAVPVMLLNLAPDMRMVTKGLIRVLTKRK